MTVSSGVEIDRGDLSKAVAFAQRCFADWHERGLVRDGPYRAITAAYTTLQGGLETGTPIPAGVQLPSPDVCWSCKRPVGPRDTACDECGAPVHNDDTRKLRYLVFVCFEVRKLQRAGSLPLASADGCLAEANARIAALRRKLDRARIPLVLAAGPGDAPAVEPAEVAPVEAAPAAPAPAAAPPASSAPPRRPRPVADAVPVETQRNLLEILLDPRSIQWLLVSGGVLLVLGLVIWLAAEGIFENPEVQAVGMGVANLALLLGGWALIGFTRHEIAGRGLTLLACLLMPLNLWFYDAQGLSAVWLDGHLWIPALVCCVLYAISARLLRDPMFVYVLVGGVALTGLLILSDRNFERFWEIAAPSTLLVSMGLIAIHAERVFPPGDSPFSRRRFGLAFFWSGQVLLAAGLLLLLGAQVCGDWLYPLFEPIYRELGAGQPEIVTDRNGRLLALCLVLAGTYAYTYSDLVVRRVGFYIYLAVFSLLWAEVLALPLLEWRLPVPELLIIALAATALIANLTLTAVAGKSSPLMRAGPPLGLALSVLPVLVGVVLHFQATSPLLPRPWRYTLTGSYVAAMLVAAVSCRISAFLFRNSRPGLSMTYFFGTGAATLVGAAGLLKVNYPEFGWEEQAPLLMVIPILYLGAAHLYRGHTPQKPLLWVAHAATLVMLVSSLGAAFKGFLLVEGQALNLSLATFFTEAALFYLLAAAWHRHAVSVYACMVMACCAAWQLLKYAGVPDEYYVLTFAGVGLLLLIAYRFAVLENMKLAGTARAAFQGGNALLTLAFVAGALLVLSELVGEEAPVHKDALIRLVSLLIVASLLAVALVRQAGWRRWYVATSIGNAALLVLVLAVLTELTPGQKLEIVLVVLGLLLLAAGHLGWYREQERESDLVTVSLFFGSGLLAVPVSVAVLYCRFTRADFDTFHMLNEVGLLAGGLVLLATGFMGKIRSTTLAGALMMVVYLVSLVLFLRVPEKLQTTAVYIMVGGGVFFATGLLLSLYRDRLLALPSRIKRREGVFRVLTWR